MDLHPRKRLHFHQPAGISRRDSRLICSLCGLLLHSYLLTPFFGCSLVAVHPLFFSFGLPGSLTGGSCLRSFHLIAAAVLPWDFFTSTQHHHHQHQPFFFPSWCVINCHRLIPISLITSKKIGRDLWDLITACSDVTQNHTRSPFFVGPLLYIRIFRVNLDDFRLSIEYTTLIDNGVAFASRRGAAESPPDSFRGSQSPNSGSRRSIFVLYLHA